MRQVTFVAPEFKGFKPELTALAAKTFPSASVEFKRTPT